MNVIRRIGAARAMVWAAATAAMCSVAPASADDGGRDWPHWRGPNYDGIAPETGWHADWGDDGPEIAWRAKIGTGFASMAVADGRVYAMGNQNLEETVYCFDAATGKPLWSHTYRQSLVNRLHEGGPSSTPTVHEGSVYTLGKDGLVHKFDAETGKVQWTAELDKLLGMKTPTWGFTSSAVIEGETVVFQAGSIVALNRKDGSLAWKSKAYEPAYSTPHPFTMNGKRYFAALNTFGLVVVEASGGKEFSNYPWKTDHDTNATTPIVQGDLLYISTGYDKGCALFRITPQQLTLVYRNKDRGRTMSNHMNNCVLVDGYLYGFDGNSHRSRNVDLVCMDFKTGKQQWRHNGLGCGSLIASDGKLIVLSDSGELIIASASPQAYKPISRAQVLGGKCWTSPVLAHGRIYVRNARGDLACVDVRPRAAE